MERQQLGDERRPSLMPGNERCNGAPFENGNHVLDPGGVLRVVVQDIEETGIHTRVEDAPTHVVIEHSVVPENVNAVAIIMRVWGRRSKWRIG